MDLDGDDGASAAGGADEDDADEEGGRRRRRRRRARGGLSRFLHLFIARADEEDEGDEDEEHTGEFAEVEQAAGGEISMQEPRKITTEMTEMMADGLGERTLSRRERREMAQRQAEGEHEHKSEEEERRQEPGVDEPTREFRPISRERAQEQSVNIEPPASLFDDEEDEEEIEPPISRRERNAPSVNAARSAPRAGRRG